MTFKTGPGDHIKLRLHDAIYRLRFYSSFLSEIFFGRGQNGKIHCCANFSIVFGSNFGGGAKVSEERGKLLEGAPPIPLRGRKPDILSLSNLHKNVASIKKNLGDKSHCVIVALVFDLKI